MPPVDQPVAKHSLTAMGRNWFVYGISSVASRLVGFLLLPVYTRVLTPEEYGIRAMVTLGVDIVGMLFSLGIAVAMVRFYAGEGGRRRPEAVSTGFIAGAGVVGVGVAIALTMAPLLARLVLGDALYAPYLRLGLVSLYAMHVFELGLAALRIRQRAGTVAMFSLAALVSSVSLNILFVVVLRWGVTGILYSEIITFSIIALVLAIRTLRDFGSRVSWGLAREMVAYGAPLTLMPFAWLAINRSDMLFLAHASSLSEVGVYSLALQYALVLLVVVIYPFRDVWDVNQFLLDATAEGRRLYRRIFHVFTTLVIGTALAGAVIAPEVIHVMAAPRFHGAASVVPLLLAAHVITGLSLFFNSGLLVKDRTALLGGLALVTAAINIGASAWLVPRYLAIGAATSRIIALTAMAALTYAVARRLWPQRPDFGALAKVVVLALAGFAASRLVPDETLVVSLALKAAIVLGVVVVGVATGVVDRDDVRRGAAIIRERLAARRRPAVPGAA
jgi:O-antigen/teichoic acid export membrane protein